MPEKEFLQEVAKLREKCQDNIESFRKMVPGSSYSKLLKAIAKKMSREEFKTFIEENCADIDETRGKIRETWKEVSNSIIALAIKRLQKPIKPEIKEELLAIVALFKDVAYAAVEELKAFDVMKTELQKVDREFNQRTTE